MQLSKETLAIFKNFGGINSHLTIKEGNKLSTVTVAGNVMAEVTVAEQFPIDFGIYDMNEFLGVMSLFESPDLDFSEKYVTIKENKNAIRYFAANIANLTPIRNLKQFPAPDIEFDLSSQMLAQIQRAASVLKVFDLFIIGDGSTVTLSVGDKKNPTGNTYSSEVGVTDKTFNIRMQVENLRMMPGDYKVSIGGKKVSRFKSTTQDLTYYVAVELDSTFEF